jgi:hypothetical protein
MSHRDAGIYQAYINPRVQCDVQAAFLGRPSSDAIFKAVSHMSRFVDPRAPTELTSGQMAALKVKPEIVQLRELRDRLSYEVREESGTLEQAAQDDSKLYQLYKQASNNLQSAKTKTLRLAKKNTRQEFFNTINTIEINKQLDPTFLDLGDDWQPPKVEHSLAERQIVADLMCKSTFGLSDEAKMEHRLQTLNALVALCRKREVPRRLKPDRTWGLSAVEQISEQIPQQIPEQIPQQILQQLQFPKTCSENQCIFCFWNSDYPNEVRLHSFSTKYKACAHVEKKHLKLYNDGLIPCPDPECQGLVLEGEMHFKSHASQRHQYNIFGKYNIRQKLPMR